MSQGYSLRLKEQNMRADPKKIGVRLGRACIEHDVPVAVVASQLGVSRATVYSWFTGASSPAIHSITAVEAYLAKL